MDLEQRVQRIEERNEAVTADKAWEVSWARGVLLAVITYGVAGLFISAVGAPNAWLSALVPAGGFLISTLTMPLFKKLWLKNRK